MNAADATRRLPADPRAAAGRRPPAPTARRVAGILERALRGERPGLRQMAELLRIQDPEQAAALFGAARRLRAAHFGGRVFLYGFLYLSTHCRNDCRFCFYRRSNRRPARYRRTEAQVAAAARRLAASGVHLVDLTLGEDPQYVARGPAGAEPLAALTAAVRRATGLPVMVSPGVLDEAGLRALAGAGADWYACYQETYDRRLFARLRCGQDFDARLAAKRAARRAGLLVEEGVLCGVGESPAALAQAVCAMRRLGAEQVRAMGFVPQPGTPMARRPPADPLRERLLIAVMRLAQPAALIPASLDVAGLDGLAARLDAGANVVTSIVPPGLGLSGVARPSLDIAEARRDAASVLPVLAAAGLRPAGPDDYRRWLAGRRAAAQAAAAGGREASCGW